MNKQLISAAVTLALIASNASGAFAAQGGNNQAGQGAGWNNRDCYNNETGAQCQARRAQEQSHNQPTAQVDHGAGWNNRDCYNNETGAQCQARIGQQNRGFDRNRNDNDRGRSDYGRNNYDRGGSDWNRGQASNYNACYRGENARDCRERLTFQQRSNHRYVWRNGRYEDDSGAAVAAGILGFILGAAIAGSDTDREYYYAHRHDHGWRDRCYASYRSSFDYDSGTYLGRDGYRHYCRL